MIILQPHTENELALCHINIQSLLAGVNTTQHIQSQLSKLDEIQTTLVHEYHFDIIAITESWLTKTHSNEDIMIENYLCFRKDRVHKRGGGLLIYTKNNLPCIRRQDLEHASCCELLCIVITQGSYKVLLCLCYRPPGQCAEEINNFLMDLQTCIDKAYAEKFDAIILTGDFNDRSVLFYEDHLTSELGNKLRDLVVGNNMFQLIKEPTHFTENSAYILDLIITDSPGYINKSGLLDPICELHHVPVYANLSICREKIPSKSREVWHYNNADIEGLNAALHDLDWKNMIENNQDINNTVTRFTETFISIAKQYIPVRKINIRSKDKPWVTPGLRKLMRLRNRWSGRYNKTGYAEHKIIRNIYRSRVKHELRRLKRNYFETQLNHLNNPELSCKKYWNIVKQLYGNKIKQPIPTLIDNNNYYVTDESKACLLNEYFAQQSIFVPPPNCHLPEFTYITDSRLESIDITPFKVSKILQRLPVKKASGPDQVNNTLLKLTADVICDPLANIFNKSLNTSLYPEDWKCANMSAVYKKGERYIKDHYRPISLLSCISKVMERLVFESMYDYFISLGLLTKYNSGFKKNDSTVNQLITLVHNIYKSLDEKNDVCMVFLDVSKAFDKVYHEGLIFKLRQLGIEGKLLKWIKSYLTNRKQRVVLNGKMSDWKHTNAGVPQGSILGPLLFLVFVNDIVDSIDSKIFVYADDTSIMRPIKDPEYDFQILNSDLHTLSKWAKQWHVTFNCAKTECMIFSLKNKPPSYPPLFLNNTIIKQVNHHTHLGLILDSKLTWKDHITKICTKASQRITNIKRIRYLIPRVTADNLYKTLVRPLLEYADVIFDNTSQLMKKKIDQVQREAIVMITCAYHRTQTVKLYTESGLEYLTDRRRNHRLTIFFKMTTGLAPEHLQEILPPSVGDNAFYRTRYNTDSSLRTVPYARTSKFANSFVIQTTKDWNTLEKSFRLEASLSSFKIKLKSSSERNTNFLLSRFTGRAVIHHTRLRLGLSPLKKHLSSYGIIENSICDLCYLEQECSIHYFLHCPHFSHQRTTMLVELCNILPMQTLIELRDENNLVLSLLNGIESIDDELNKILFKIVLHYIQSTERFL